MAQVEPLIPYGYIGNVEDALLSLYSTPTVLSYRDICKNCFHVQTHKENKEEFLLFFLDLRIIKEYSSLPHPCMNEYSCLLKTQRHLDERLQAITQKGSNDTTKNCNKSQAKLSSQSFLGAAPTHLPKDFDHHNFQAPAFFLQPYSLFLFRQLRPKPNPVCPPL